LSPAADIAVQRIGRYEVRGELGTGGMAVVYRAHDPRLERDVAVKVLHPHLARDPESRARFEREARAAARLRHPNIVEVYEFSDPEERESYMVTELLEGPTLRRFAERHPDVPAEVAAAVGVVLCDALACAHAQGVVHRDVKPDNLMLQRGQVKLTDFGIAHVADGRGMTVTGQVLGSPAHMAPEQIEGSAVDARTDVFAAGTVLYQLAVGRLPFEGTTAHALLRKILEGQFTDAARAAPKVGHRFAAVLAKALARDPEARYPSAEALRDDLCAFLKEVGWDAPDKELRAYFEDPEAVVAALHERLKGRLPALGEQCQREGRNGEAMGYFNRALALDPENPGALRTFVRLLVEPPREVPAEVEAKMTDDYNARRLGSFRGGAIAFAIWLALTPLAVWIGVRDWGSFLSMAALVAACAALCLYVGRTARHVEAIQRTVMLFAVTAAAFTTRLFGPFVLVPALIVVVTFVFSMTPDLRWRRLFMALGSLGMVGPILLEVSGVIAPSYVFHDGLIELHPRMTWLTAGPSLVSLMLVHLGLLLAMVQVVGRMRDAFDVVSRRLHLQAWQLRQIVPSDAAGTS
jgi:tetratricopeptide (TPR) repeat protein